MGPMVVIARRNDLPAFDHDSTELEAHRRLRRHLSTLRKIKLRLIHCGYMRL